MTKLKFGAWTEAIVGALSGGAVLALPTVVGWLGGLGGGLSDLFISNQQITAALGFGLAATGGLQSLSRHKFEARFAQDLQRLAQLANAVDVSQAARYDLLREVFDFYNRITNSNLIPIKNEILVAAKFNLAKMANDLSSPPLSASTYTKEEAKALENANAEQP